jgi:hypothetical protein
MDVQEIFWVKLRKNREAVWQIMQNAYGTEAMSQATVCLWWKNFKTKWKKRVDNAWSGRTSTSVTDDSEGTILQHWLSCNKLWTMFTMQIYLKVIYRMSSEKKKDWVLDETVSFASRQYIAIYCICHDRRASRHWWHTCRTLTLSPDLVPCDFWAFPTLKHDKWKQHHTLLEGTTHKQGIKLQIADITQQRAYE